MKIDGEESGARLAPSLKHPSSRRQCFDRLGLATARASCAGTYLWFEAVGQKSWATCPLTQLAFVRISANPKIISAAVSPRAAAQTLGKMTALPGHVFWADDLDVNNLASFTSTALVGHRQVTDAYLLELAKHHNGKVATLDAGLAELLPLAERVGRVAAIGDR